MGVGGARRACRRGGEGRDGMRGRDCLGAGGGDEQVETPLSPEMKEISRSRKLESKQSSPDE